MEELKVRLTILFFLISAVLCLLVSMNTDNWTEHQGVFSGLWRKCKKTKWGNILRRTFQQFFTWFLYVCKSTLRYSIRILYCWNFVLYICYLSTSYVWIDMFYSFCHHWWFEFVNWTFNLYILQR
uniref:Claudin-like 6 n=1 Tax=Hydra vulgaris TaxID=6087 RepID=A0A0H5G5D3_HYDVU|nr:Claudin-like 6 [Hydra vulgaris]